MALHDDFLLYAELLGQTSSWRSLETIAAKLQKERVWQRGWGRTCETKMTVTRGGVGAAESSQRSLREGMNVLLPRDRLALVWASCVHYLVNGVLRKIIIETYKCRGLRSPSLARVL